MEVCEDITVAVWKGRTAEMPGWLPVDEAIDTSYMGPEAAERERRNHILRRVRWPEIVKEEENLKRKVEADTVAHNERLDAAKKARSQRLEAAGVSCGDQLQQTVKTRLRGLLGSPIAHFRRTGIIRDFSPEGRELVGCSMDELVEHIESQFYEGMTWGNTHVDHIRPCVMFDLTQKDQAKECFNFINLQPLFADDNWRKGSRL